MADFSIDLKSLKRRSKPSSQVDVARVDMVGENQGFVDRPIQKKRGRPKSERTGQVHAKVMPNISNEIAAEAIRRGVQQGVLIEEAWNLYCIDRRLFS